MARRALLATAFFLTLALSGCISYETSYSHEEPDGCWMWCNSEVSYSGFIWFPIVIVMMVLVGVIIAVAVAASNNQQQVIIQQKEEKD